MLRYIALGRRLVLGRGPSHLGQDSPCGLNYCVLEMQFTLQREYPCDLGYK